MLAEARRKLEILLIQGAAEALPVADASTDFLTLSSYLKESTGVNRVCSRAATAPMRRLSRP